MILSNKPKPEKRPGPTLAEDAAKVERSLRSNPVTSEFFRTLVGTGDSTPLTHLIVQMLRMPVARPSVKSPEFSRSLRTTKNYPNSLRSWADEIKRKSAFLFPKGDIYSQECEYRLRALA